jgi:hypothetical protein
MECSTCDYIFVVWVPSLEGLTSVCPSSLRGLDAWVSRSQGLDAEALHDSSSIRPMALKIMKGSLVFLVVKTVIN